MENYAHKQADAIASPERLAIHEKEWRPEHAFADRVFVLIDQAGLCGGVLYTGQHCISFEPDRRTGVSSHRGIAGGATFQPVFAVSGLGERDGLGWLLLLDPIERPCRRQRMLGKVRRHLQL